MRDLVLIPEVNGGERFSEMVAVVSSVYKKLTDQTLPINFVDHISFNNSRTKKSAGSTTNVTFEAGKEQHTTFSKGKKAERSLVSTRAQKREPGLSLLMTTIKEER